MRVHEPLTSHQEDVDSFSLRKGNASGHEHLHKHLHVCSSSSCNQQEQTVTLVPLKQGA